MKNFFKPIALCLSTIVAGATYADSVPKNASSTCTNLAKEQLREARNLLSSLKAPAEEYFAGTAKWASIEELSGFGYKTAGKYTANIISSDFDFFFQATMKTLEEGVEPAVAGKTIRLFYNIKTRDWKLGRGAPNGVSQQCLASVPVGGVVTEAILKAIGLLSGLKTPAEEYFAATAKWASVEELGGKTAGKYTANIISGDLFFQATLRTVEEGINPLLAAKTIRLTYNSAAMLWQCSAGEPNGVPSEFLPSTCW